MVRKTSTLPSFIESKKFVILGYALHCVLGSLLWISFATKGVIPILGEQLAIIFLGCAGMAFATTLLATRTWLKEMGLPILTALMVICLTHIWFYTPHNNYFGLGNTPKNLLVLALTGAMFAYILLSVPLALLRIMRILKAIKS